MSRALSAGAVDVSINPVGPRAGARLAALFAVMVIVASTLGFLFAAPASAVPAPGPPAPAPAAPAPAAPDPASGVAGSVANNIGTDATNGIQTIIARGAIDAMAWTLRYIDVGTTPTLNQPNGWFVGQYAMMVQMGVWVMLPLLMIAIIHAIAKGSMHMLLRSVLVYLPVSILGTVVAVQLVQLLINMTDDFSEVFIKSVQGNWNSFWAGIAQGFSGSKGGLFNWIIVILLSMGMMAVCVALYIVLVLREASVYIATSFLPIGFATLVWPSSARFLRRMVEFLLAMIMSKMVMVGGIALAMASLSNAVLGSSATATALNLNGTPTATAATGIGVNNNGGANDPFLIWLAQTVEAIVMFGIVTISPMMTMKLVGNIGVGEMASHVGSHLERPGPTRQLVYTKRMLDIGNGAIRIKNNFGGPAAARRRGRTTSKEDVRLNQMGIERNEKTKDYELTDGELNDAGITDATRRAHLKSLSGSNDANDIALAHAVIGAAHNFRAEGGVDLTGKGGIAAINVGTSLHGNTIVDMNKNHVIVFDIKDRTTGADINFQDPKLVNNAIRDSFNQPIAANNATSVRILAPLDGGRGRDQNNVDQLQNIANTWTTGGRPVELAQLEGGRYRRKRVYR